MAVGVGILGGGVVGGALAAKLIEERDEIASKSGIDLEVIGVAVRDPGKPRVFPERYATTDPDSLIADDRVDLVVELMGGLEPARRLVLAALDAGKPVVTGNKELVAADGPELFDAAARSGVSLLFEAAVGGGIPLIRPLSESLAGERITRVLGIVNGTTNYILSAMTAEGRDFEDVLAEAQRLGYAEQPDPSADTEGHDAASKAAIVAGLAFGVWVGRDRVHTEGITGISAEDVAAATRLGYVIKLLAVAEAGPEGCGVRVHPALVPTSHPLANVNGANNAVFVEGPAIGQLLFMGPGAGGDPTATAVLGDMIDASRELLAGTQVAPKIRFSEGEVAGLAQMRSRWCVRLEVEDAPGVLAKIAARFGDHDVSIRSVWQEGAGGAATLLLVTHEAAESNLQAAVDELAMLDVVKQVASLLRVIGEDG